MDLMIFTTNFPLGSSEQFLESEILYLSKTFDHITIVPLTDSGQPHPRFIPENIGFLPPILSVSLTDRFLLFIRAILNKAPVRPFLSDFFTNKVYLRKSWFMHWLSASSIARASLASDTFRKVTKMMTSPTLIYFYWGDKSSALCPFLKKQFPGNKYIARFHGTDLYETKTPGYMPFRKELTGCLDLAVFISDDGRRFFQDRYPSIQLRTLVSRLGVTDNGAGFPSGDKVLRIITCSNVVRIKRLHLLVEALNKVHIPVEWKHIGDGELLDELKGFSRSLPLEIRVTFPGSIKNSEVIQYYRTQPVDLFINTSSHEGLPVSIMEAISFGIPVIAPDVGGIREILGQEHGFLLSADASPDEIAGAIKEFYDLPAQKKEEMRNAARKFWKKHYDAEVNYTEFCRHLKLLMPAETEGFPSKPGMQG